MKDEKSASMMPEGFIRRAADGLEDAVEDIVEGIDLVEDAVERVVDHEPKHGPPTSIGVIKPQPGGLLALAPEDCLLLIERIEPDGPLPAGSQVKIIYSLTLGSGLTVDQGRVSAGGDKMLVTNLAPGTTTFGSLVTTVPSNGQILLEFRKLPTEEISPADCEASKSVLTTAKYMVTLDAINISRPRSSRLDTDYVALAGQVGDQPVQSAKSFLGNLGHGQHPVHLSIGPFEVSSGSDSGLTLSFVITNMGHPKSEDELNAALDYISRATHVVLSVTYPAWAGVWTILDELTQYLNALFTASCDGQVAGDKVNYPGALLDSLTKAGGGSFTETRRYDGTPSPPICGDESLYFVTWTVSRV